MLFAPYLLLLATLLLSLDPISAFPMALDSSSQKLSNTTYGPIPGQSSYYSNYNGTFPPFPANITAPILPTASGDPGPDDELWQNLLSAEWIVYSFYQQAVELFNTSSFTALGLPNTTYQRIVEIRDNEAGHLRIFQDQISATSIKPGACKYQYPFTTPDVFLPFVSFIEVSSMAFITGLAEQAKLNSSKGALVAIGETESRHNTWSLIDIWNISPFAGPADTSYPYANQILDLTNVFVVNGSCPVENPTYPAPRQNLPRFASANGTKSVAPGSRLVIEFTEPDNQPQFCAEKDYYAVYFHGVSNITVPFDPKTNSMTIPAEFEAKGLILGVITDEPGAPTLESCLAGPQIFLQQPGQFGVVLSSSL
ncbi:hypothetical protein D0Z07_8545 [Hyphodiscus hymeniophilus]|uniref:Uncharacterized protein n=1 Tax=Hyphodiscus hymeniophilus TaxID=353542 RepID=A0A9P6SN32_9HELO|nr:hypothetical protein D0Z07_8545 [Hyphodiscus hymeniophilus]